ncbi:MAG: molybdate ABC transporter substrate-binding protein [Actinomycetota bacterium]
MSETTTSRRRCRAALRHISVVAVAGLFTIGCGTDEDRLVVFAASSLDDVMSEIGEAFEEQTGVRVDVNVAASSTLRLQLDEGAGADVFVPADPGQIDRLAAPPIGARQPIARTRLVVAVPLDAPDVTIDRFDEAELVLGVCAPAVPCGALARRALASAGIVPSIDTEEPNVRSLASKIAERELDAGIVYATDVVADSRLRALPIEPAVDVVYAAAPLDGDGDARDRDRFIEFLRGTVAVEILIAAGFEAS